ncbi:MFS transporter [Rathayibacter soli]|uniref:MFS transporter n=1 Tax=Rathayibacter soli TaxID=3144168 RepID=UPI0027E3EAD7|nr:MFS transporter [Glaciibacter superstes]
MSTELTPVAEPMAARRLGRALVTIGLLGAVIGSLGAPLITPVATGMHVSLDAAQWTLTITLFSGAISGPIVARLGSGSRRRVTILVTLALVALGGALTTIPFSFAFLLLGRALQGLGLGVIALLMSVARDQFPARRSASTIATLSVASTVGIGVGYPLVGLLDQIAGLRVAYGLGLILSLVSLVIAWRALPADAPVLRGGVRVRVDVAGALLLGAAILGVLLVIAQPAVWGEPWVGGSILASALVLFGAWVVVELRTSAPLADLRLLGQPGVLRANIGMLVAGVGMYLLFSLLTRYVQTPVTVGYGFGLPGVLAGAALIPFSVLGFVAGKLTPISARRFSRKWVYLAAAFAVMIAAGLFALVSDSLPAVLLAMAILGFGVGGVSAIMPALVLVDVPQPETASVLSINQLVRSVGFSMGSALAGLLLAAATPAGSVFPSEQGYADAALWVIPLLAFSAVPIFLTRRAGAR